MRTIFYIFAASLTLMSAPLWAQAQMTSKEVQQSDFLTQHPGLKDIIYKEPGSKFYWGVGATPVAFVGSKISLGLSVLQIHYIGKKLDLEILNASFLFAFGTGTNKDSRHFIMRTAPKWRFNAFLSLGLLLGYEVVSFPEVKARMESRTSRQVTQFEPFSSRGLIYGLVASQTFDLSKDRKMRISQVYFKEKYRAKETDRGWVYNFNNEETGESNPQSSVNPKNVFMIEAAYLF